MADYRFVSTWKLRTPVDDVYRLLRHPERWRWPGLQRVQRLEAGDDASGDVHRFFFRAPLGYTLTFDLRTTLVEPPRLLEARAEGELEGTSRWELHEHGGVTTAVLTWTVRTTKGWMNVVAPLARPVFSWAHAVVMRRGAQGMAQVLDAELVAAESAPASGGDKTPRVRALLATAVACLLLAGSLGRVRRRLRAHCCPQGRDGRERKAEGLRSAPWPRWEPRDGARWPRRVLSGG